MVGFTSIQGLLNIMARGNPYVVFGIAIIEHKSINRKITDIRFILTERCSINILLSDSLDGHCSPVDTQKLSTMLISYWTKHLKYSFLSYALGNLISLLQQFR